MVVAGEPHHVTQRGNRREDVFLNDEDRQRYLDLLGKYAVKHELAVIAWCLMNNHIHLVVVPAREESLAGCLGPVHLRYAQHVNRSHRWQGRVWQGRYYSCVLDGPHLAAAVRYVERNPVRAGLVARAEDWRWSSAAGHCGLAPDALVTSEPNLAAVAAEHGGWSAWLSTGDEPAELSRVREATRTGRPLGEPGFVAGLEERLGRRLTAAPVGRPRKTKK